MTEQNPTSSETDAVQDGGQPGTGATDAPARAPRRRATRRASAPVTTAGGDGSPSAGDSGEGASDSGSPRGASAQAPNEPVEPSGESQATTKPARARRSRTRATAEVTSTEPGSAESTTGGAPAEPAEPAEPRRPKASRSRKAKTPDAGTPEVTDGGQTDATAETPDPAGAPTTAEDEAPARKRPSRRRATSASRAEAASAAPEPEPTVEPAVEEPVAEEDEDESGAAQEPATGAAALDVLAELGSLREAAEGTTAPGGGPAASTTALLFQPPQPARRRRAQAPAGPPRAKDDSATAQGAPQDDDRTASRDETAGDGAQTGSATSTDVPDGTEEGRSSGRSRRSRGGRGRRTSVDEGGEATEPTDATDASDAGQSAARGARKGRGATQAEPGADEENDAQADPQADQEQQDDDQGDDARRRRRRRGGRGRRRSGGGDGDDSASDESSADDTDAEAGESNEAESDGAPDAEESGEGGSSRRRRRRRRSGRGEGGEDEAAAAPARSRSRSRSGSGTSSDEVTALKGSTRLEAKRQRRREGRDAGRRRSILTEAEFLARREAVDRDMVVRERDGRVQIAVLEDKVLVEHFVSRTGGQNNGTSSSMVGNVYLGRVQNVLPSMEAAFVDLGKGRNAVLYAGEVNWDAAGLEGQPRRIEQALKSGDSVLVQVTKDPIGHKGARLTSQITLAGRYLVYVPGGGMTGISRKLPENERARLKKLLKEIVPDAAGVIVRTAAEGASDEELRLDVQRLQDQWAAIEKKSASASAPALLQGEPDLAIRVVRDIFNDDFRSLVVQGDDAWSMISEYVGAMAPDLADRVTRWTGQGDVFSEHRIDEQLAKGMDRKVWLPSGGSLVIDRTEAMTVIDVNTGKFTGAGGTLEETVTRNNLEAAEEIVRQLRLRDIGGIIVIDFIDMVLESNRDLVLRRLVECLGRDRTKHQVAEVTSLGLVQMTRKRVGQGLVEAFSETCEHCHGRGFLVRDEPVVRGGGEQPSSSDDASGGEGRRSRRKKPAGSGAPVPVVPVLPEAREAVKATLATIAAAAAHAHEHDHDHDHDGEHSGDHEGDTVPTDEAGEAPAAEEAAAHQEPQDDAQGEAQDEAPAAEPDARTEDAAGAVDEAPADTEDVTSAAPAAFDQEG